MVYCPLLFIVLSLSLGTAFNINQQQKNNPFFPAVVLKVRIHRLIFFHVTGFNLVHVHDLFPPVLVLVSTLVPVPLFLSCSSSVLVRVLVFVLVLGV